MFFLQSINPQGKFVSQVVHYKNHVKFADNGD